MLFVWRGYGIIVPIIFFIIAWVVSFWIEDTTLGNAFFTGWSLIVSGLLISVIGVLFQNDPSIEDDTNKKTKHDFFFIPVLYWGIGFVCLGLYLLFF